MNLAFVILINFIMIVGTKTVEATTISIDYIPDSEIINKFKLGTSFVVKYSFTFCIFSQFLTILN
jgi:hypothetical protein